MPKYDWKRAEEVRVRFFRRYPYVCKQMRAALRALEDPQLSPAEAEFAAEGLRSALRSLERARRGVS